MLVEIRSLALLSSLCFNLSYIQLDNAFPLFKDFSITLCYTWDAIITYSFPGLKEKLVPFLFSFISSTLTVVIPNLSVVHRDP